MITLVLVLLRAKECVELTVSRKLPESILTQKTESTFSFGVLEERHASMKHQLTVIERFTRTFIFFI